MAFDINNKTALYFVDEHDMAMTQNPSWDLDGDNGEGDSVGRCFDGYIAWKYGKFIDAVKKCFVLKTNKRGKTYLQGYRHPNRLNDEYNDMSRDHTLYMLIFMKYAGEDEYLKMATKKLRWRISDKFTFTPESWLWMKAIGGSKIARFFYYLTAVPIMIFSILWNKAIYKIAGFEEESHQDDYVKILNEDISEKKRKWRKLLYPIYAMYESAFQTYVMPDTIGKKIMQKVTLWGTPKHNYMMKVVLGGDVTEEEILGYKAMTGWRFSTTMNQVNDRDMEVITKPEYLAANVLDVDLLHVLYEESLN